MVPSWYALLRGRPAGPGQPWTRSYYWLPFTDLLGLDGRWGGPLRHPNPTGGIAAVRARLRLHAPAGEEPRLQRHRCPRPPAHLTRAAPTPRRRSGSSSSPSCPAGGCSRGGGPRVRRIVALGIGVAPGSSGRVVGAGGSGADGPRPDVAGLPVAVAAVAACSASATAAIDAARWRPATCPPWATHGHNLYIDTLVRYGIVGTVLRSTDRPAGRGGRARVRPAAPGPRRAARGAHGAGDHDRGGDRVRLAVPERGADPGSSSRSSCCCRSPTTGWTGASRAPDSRALRDAIARP